MDAFFAAVEALDDPSLAGRPVVVGGDGPRGVVASCSYEARVHGVRSAMASIEARRRCPDAVFVAPRHRRYAEVSAELYRLLRQTTPLVEPVGLDEAFLDVAGARRRLGPPEAIARRLVEQVRAELHLTCAAGVARSKSLAKLASRRAKAVPPARRGPGDGVVVVPAGDEVAFLHPLPVDALWGVGPATAGRLAALGITTVGDLANVPEPVLVRHVGAAAGAHLAMLANGRDRDPVVPDRPVKSVGREVTLPADLRDRQALHTVLAELAGSVGDRLGRASLVGRTVTVKVRFTDRRTITRSATVEAGVTGPQQVLAVARSLFGAIDVVPGVRLVGIAASNLCPVAESAAQLTFGPVACDAAGDRCWGAPAAPAAGSSDEPGPERAAGRWRKVDGALAAVRSRFGPGAVVPGIAVGPDDSP